MFNRMMGKSERKSQDESSSFSRRSEDDRRRQRTQTDSVVSSTSARKSSRGDDRDRDFNPTSTSYSSTSRNPYRGTTSDSVASSYATASSKPRDATNLPPELVRNSALINETTHLISEREERDRDEDINRKSGKRRERSTSKDRKSRRSGSLDRAARKKEKKERQERKKDDDGRKDRGVTRSESDYMRERGVSRAESMPLGGSRNFSAQIGGSGFTQFPGQYDGGLPSFSPRPVHHPEGMSTHVQDQFPGQFPAESTAPYRPPIATNEGGPGLATEYYGDAGESVAYQPGVRPQPPSLIVGAEPHLQAALAVAAPPPEPSASGSVGAAASFYSTSENFQSPSMSASKLSNQPRPGASSQVSSSSGPAAMAGGAALGYIAASHHDRVNNQSSQSYSNRPPYQPSFPLTSPNITTNVGYSNNANHSTSAPVLPTLAAAATGAAAGYIAGNIPSPHRQDSMTQKYSTTSHASNLTNVSQRPQTNVTSQTETFIVAEHSQTPGRHSSNPSKLPLYAAGAAGIAGLAAAEYQHNHNDHDSNHNLSYTQRYQSGSMAQRHRHHGPLDKFVDFWKDPDGVAQFEEYTEYIGVCRYCFAPDSSPRDAPRKHHYRRRKGSNERYGSSIRVDKDSRYSSSDGETRRKSKNSWLATGLVGYGLAKVGENLFSTKNDEDNVYDLRRTRVNKSSTSLNSHRRNSSTERRSHTSRGVTRRSDVWLPSRSPSRGQVETGITADGKVYRREKFAASPGGLTATTHGSRYRSRSRSRERKTGITEAIAGATVGTAALASSLQKRSESPEKPPLRLNHQSKERHSEEGLSLDTVPSSRRHDDHISSNLSRRSLSTKVDARSSNSELKSGFFGGFFSSPPEKRRNRGKKSKNNGFFTFENRSSSSADTNLAFGSRSDLSRTKQSSKRREKPHKNSNTALLGLGAAAAMIAANEARKHDQGKRRADFVAVKDTKDHHKRTSESAHKMITVAPSGVDEEAWESASEDDDVASIDSTLAYGMHRRSHESLRSDSSGTEKWGWRWGGKKTRRQSSQPQRNYSTGAAAALAGVAVGAALTSQGHQQPQQNYSHSELPPLQHVYPVPTSDPSHYDVIRHNSMISSTEPLVTARPGPIPLQQPQPVTQVPSAVYATQAPYGHSYSAPSGPPVMSQLPHHYAPVSSNGRPLESGQALVLDSFPHNDYPPQAILRREATNDGSSIRRESPMPSKSNYSTDSRRPSAREDAPGVRFDLTKEHEDRERRDRRRQEKEERRARRESEAREAMEQADLERERRQPEKVSEELVDDKAKRLEQIDRELEMLKRQGPGAKSDKSNTWNAALTGVAGAAIGAAIVKDGERHEEREQQRRDVLDQNTFDIENRRVIVEEDLERTNRAEKEARIARQAAAKIRKTPSPVHENYATYFVPPELSQAHKADNAIDPTSPRVITIEPGEHRDTSAISNTLPHPDDETDSKRMSSTLPWHLPRIGMTLNLIQPTPPASTTGSTKGDSSPLIRAQNVAEPVIIEVSPESRRSSRVTFSEPDYYEYEVITPVEHRDEFVEHDEISRDSEDTQYGVHTKEFQESINNLSEGTPPIEEIPRAERMPGGFDDDIDFAATVAAGLEHTGFDPSIVIDDPDFRRRESPPGSEQFPFHRSPFTTNLSDLGLDSPGTEGAPPVRGFVIGELPPTPKEVTLSSSIGEDKLDLGLTEREKNEEEEAVKHQHTEDVVKTAADLVRPAHEDEIIDMSPAYKANVEMADSGTRGVIEEFDSTVSPIRSKSKLEKNRKNGSAYEPQSIDSTIEREVVKDKYFDATESPKLIAEDVQQKYLQEIATNIPLPDDKDGSPLFDQRDSFPEITKSIDETELYDSPSEEVASIAASAPALGDYQEPRKHKKKKSKHRNSEFNDTASLTSAPAAFDDTRTSNSKSKKERKGGLFGLFGRSVSDSAEVTRSKDSPSEATFEEFEERTKKSRKSKERRATRDDNDLYSLASASTVDVSRLDDEEGGEKSRRARENGGGEKRRRHRDSRRDDDSGRITQDLPAKVYVPVSPGHTPEFSESASLTDPENREYTAAKAEPPSLIDPVEGTIHDEQKISMSFLGERQEPKRPPDIEKKESFTEYPSGIEPFFQDSVESRLTSPTLAGSTEDLHSVPTDPSVSSEITLIDRPKRLSMLRLTDPSHPNASASPTAIPINLRTPRFAGFSRSSPSTPEASTENSMHFTPRQRQPRPSSTEFKFSTEFRPLWLVERHSTRQVPTTDEIYPSLPSSHSTSRASSIHGAIEDHDPFRDVAPDYVVDSSPPAETPSLKIDTGEIMEPDLLGSQQATPTVASFQSYPMMDADLPKRDGNLTEHTLGGIQAEDPVLDPLQRITHSVDDFFPDRRSQSPSRYNLEQKVDLPLPQIDQGIEHDAPSMNNDVGLESLTGAVAVAASQPWSPYHEQHTQEESLIKSPEDVEPAEKTLEQSKDETLLADEPDFSLSTKSKKKKNKKQRKASEVTSAQDNLSDIETSSQSASGKYMGVEDRRKLEEQDAQDAVDSWFAPSIPKKVKKEIKGKKTRYVEVQDPGQQSAEISGTPGLFRSVNTDLDFIAENAFENPHIQPAEESESLGPANTDSSKADTEHVEPGTLTKDMSSAEVVAVMATAAATAGLLNESADSTIASSQVIPNLHPESSSRGVDEVVLPKSPVEQPDLVENATADIDLPTQLEREVSYETNSLSSPSDFYAPKKNKKGKEKSGFPTAEPGANLEEQGNTDTLPIDEPQPDQADKQIADVAISRKKKGKKGRKALQWNEPEETFASGGREQSELEYGEENNNLSRSRKPAEDDILASGDMVKDSQELADFKEIEIAPASFAPEEVALPAGDDVDLYEAYHQESITEPALRTVEEPSKDAVLEKLHPPLHLEDVSLDENPTSKDDGALGLVTDAEFSDAKELPSAEPRFSYGSSEQAALPEEQDVDLLDALPENPLYESQEINKQDVKEPLFVERRLPYISPEEVALPEDQDLNLLDALPESPALESQEMSDRDAKELPFTEPRLSYHSPEDIMLPEDQDLDLLDTLPESFAVEAQNTKELSSVEPRLSYHSPEDIVLPEDQDLDLLDALPESPVLQAQEMSEQDVKEPQFVERRLIYISPEEVTLPEDQDLDLLDALPESPALEAYEMIEQEHSSGLVECLLLDQHEPTSQSREPEVNYPLPEENSSLYVPGLPEKSDFDEALREMAITDERPVGANNAIDDYPVQSPAPIDKDLVNAKSLDSSVDPMLQDSTEDDFAVSNEEAEKGNGIDSSLPATPIAGNNVEEAKVNPFANAEIIQSIQESQVETPQGLESRRQAVQSDEMAPSAKRKDKKRKKRGLSYQELPLESIKEPDTESSATYDDTILPLDKISDSGEIQTAFNPSDREPKRFNEFFNSKNLPEDIGVLEDIREVSEPTTQDQDTSKSYNSLMKEPIAKVATPDPVQDDECAYKTRKSKKGKKSQGVALEGASSDQRSELSPQESVQSLAVADTPRQIPSMLDAPHISADRGPTISLETTEPDEDLWDRLPGEKGKKGKKSVGPGVVDVEGSVLPKTTEVPPAKDGSTGDTSLGTEVFKEFSTKGSKKAKKNKRKTLSTALSRDADSLKPLDQASTLEKSPSREYTLPNVAGPEVENDSAIPSEDVTIPVHDHDVLREPEVRESENSGQPLTEIGHDVHELTIQGPITISDVSDQPRGKPGFESRDHQHSEGEATLRQAMETPLPVDDSEREGVLNQDEETFLPVDEAKGEETLKQASGTSLQAGESKGEETLKQAVETFRPIDESEGEPKLKDALDDPEEEVKMKQASGISFHVNDSEEVALKQAIETPWRVNDSKEDAAFEQAVNTSLPCDDANEFHEEVTSREEASFDTILPPASQEEETVLSHEAQPSASDRQLRFDEDIYRSSQPISPADDSENIPKTHEISEEVKTHDEVNQVLHAQPTIGRQVTPVFSPIEFTDDNFQEEAEGSALPLNDADDYFGDQSKQYQYLEDDIDDGRDFMMSLQLGRLPSLPHVEPRENGTPPNAVSPELPTISPTNEVVCHPNEPLERVTSYEDHSKFHQEGPFLVGSSESRPFEEGVVNEAVTSAMSEDNVEEFHAVDRAQGAKSYEPPPYMQDTIGTQGNETSDRASGRTGSPKEAETTSVESAWQNPLSRENTVAFKPESDPDQSLFETPTTPIRAEQVIEAIAHHPEIREENNITENQHALPTEEQNEIEAPDAENMIEESQKPDASRTKQDSEQITDKFDSSEVSSVKKTKNGKEKAGKSQPLDWTEEPERLKEDEQSIPTMVDDSEVTVKDESAVSGSQIPSFDTVVASKGEPKSLESPNLKKIKKDKRKEKKEQTLNWIDEPVTPLKEEISTPAIAPDIAKNFELSEPSTPLFENVEDGKAEPTDLASSTSKKSKKDKRKGKKLLSEWNDEPDSEVLNASTNLSMARSLEEPNEIAEEFQVQEDQLDDTPETPFEPEAEETSKLKRSKKEKKRSKKSITFDLNEDPNTLPSQQTPLGDANPVVKEVGQAAARATGLETPGNSVDAFSSVKGKKNKKKGKKSQFVDWLEPEPSPGTELEPEPERVNEPETEREPDLKPKAEDVIEPESDRVLELESENVVEPRSMEHVIQPERELAPDLKRAAEPQYEIVAEPEREVESESVVNPEPMAESEIAVEHKSPIEPEATMETESAFESQPELQPSDLPRDEFDRDEEGITQTSGNDMRDLERTSDMENMSKSKPIAESQPEHITESRSEPNAEPQPEPESSEILSTSRDALGLAVEGETQPLVNEKRDLEIISDVKVDEPEHLTLKEGMNDKSKERGLQTSNRIEESRLYPYEATAAKSPEADSQDSPNFAKYELRGFTPESTSKSDGARSEGIEHSEVGGRQTVTDPVVFESGDSGAKTRQEISQGNLGVQTGHETNMADGGTRDAGSFEEATREFDGSRSNNTKKAKKSKKSSKKAQSSLENDQVKSSFDSETPEADDQGGSGFIQDDATKPDEFEFSDTKKTKKQKKKGKKEQISVEERESESTPKDEQSLDVAAEENLGVRDIGTSDIGALEESIADPDKLGSFSLKRTKEEKKKSKKASNVFDEELSQLNPPDFNPEPSTPVYTELQQDVLEPETQQGSAEFVPARLDQDPNHLQEQESDKIERQFTEYQENLSLPKEYSPRLTPVSNQQISEPLKDDVATLPQEQIQHPYNEGEESIHSIKSEVEYAAFNPADDIPSNIVNLPESGYLQDASVAVRSPDPSTNPFVSEERVFDEGTSTSIQEDERINSLPTDEQFRDEAVVKEPEDLEKDRTENKPDLDFVGYVKKKNKKSKRKGQLLEESEKQPPASTGEPSNPLESTITTLPEGPKDAPSQPLQTIKEATDASVDELLPVSAESQQFSNHTEASIPLQSEWATGSRAEGIDYDEGRKTFPLPEASDFSTFTMKPKKKGKKSKKQQPLMLENENATQAKIVDDGDPTRTINTELSPSIPGARQVSSGLLPVEVSEEPFEDSDLGYQTKIASPVQESVLLDEHVSAEGSTSKSFVPQEDFTAYEEHDRGPLIESHHEPIKIIETRQATPDHQMVSDEREGDDRMEKQRSSTALLHDPYPQTSFEQEPVHEINQVSEARPDTGTSEFVLSGPDETSLNKSWAFPVDNNDNKSTPQQAISIPRENSPLSPRVSSEALKEVGIASFDTKSEETSKNAVLEYQPTPAQPQEDDKLSANQPKEPWELPVPQKGKKAKGLKRHSDNFDLPDPSNLQKSQLKDETHPESGPQNTESRARGSLGAKRTLTGVGAGIALFESFQQADASQDTKKSKKKRKGSRLSDSDEITENISSLAQNQVQNTQFPASSSYKHDHGPDVKDNGEDDPPSHEPQMHHPPSLPVTTTSQPWASEPRSPAYRDSGVHIFDSPMLPEHAPVYNNVRDSGYQGTETSPTVGSDHESSRRTVNEQDAITSHDRPSNYGRQDRSQSYEEPHTANSTNRSSEAQTSENPLKISIKVDPTYNVSISRSERPQSYTELDQDNSQQRYPSPVDSTSKDRSSVLFESSPSTREEGAVYRKNPAVSPPSRLALVDESTAGSSSGLFRATVTPNQERSLLNIESNTHQAPPASLFGGPVGFNSDLAPSSSPPVGTDSSSRRKLNTIAEYSPEESPLNKKSRDVSDVGVPEHGVKTLRRSETPQGFSQHQVKSPQGREVQNSKMISTDELLSRMSWPAVDEDNHAVDLDRSISRNTSSERRASGHQSHVSLASADPSKHHEAEKRSFSGASIRSGESIHAIIRSPDALSTKSSGTPPLRRIDRSISGDLRGASKRGEAKKLAKQADAALESQTVASSSTYDPVTDKGKARIIPMTDVYEGWGDVQASPRSPMRPPSIRRHQSMQILDLETRLDQLVSENRLLQEAKTRAERSLDDASHSHDRDRNGLKEALETRDLWLRQKDAELDELRGLLEGLQHEVSQLNEVNEGLTGARSEFAAEHQQRYNELEAEHINTHRQWQESTKELEQLKQKHTKLASGMEGIVRHEINIALDKRNTEIRELRNELLDAKEQVRRLQQQILASKPTDDFLTNRDEDYFDNQCQQLCQHVQQWVLRFSKFSDMRPSRSMADVADDKITDRFDNAILDGSDVDVYLSDRVKRRDVFMSVVMAMVWEYIFTRYLFGMDREQRQKLKSLEKTLAEVAPLPAVHKWRATTLAMLSQREAFMAQRAQDSEAVVQEIYDTLAVFLPPPSHLVNQIQESLRNVMRTAVDLSIEMRTQKAEYIMLPPLRPEYDTNGDLIHKVHFNASLMNERSGNTTSNEELSARQAVVRMVLFPLVVKKGDDQGQSDEEIVICPAQVLVTRENDGRGKQKSSARSVSGGDRMEGLSVGNRSVQSFAPSSMKPGMMGGMS